MARRVVDVIERAVEDVWVSDMAMEGEGRSVARVLGNGRDETYSCSCKMKKKSKEDHWSVEAKILVLSVE